MCNANFGSIWVCVALFMLMCVMLFYCKTIFRISMILLCGSMIWTKYIPFPDQVDISISNCCCFTLDSNTTCDKLFIIFRSYPLIRLNWPQSIKTWDDIGLGYIFNMVTEGELIPVGTEINKVSVTVFWWYHKSLPEPLWLTALQN